MTQTRTILAAAVVILGAVAVGAATATPPSSDPSGLREVHAPRTIVADIVADPGTCHYRTGTGGEVLPDPACTPGSVDPAVTQANIATTICKAGYTDTIRPSSSVARRWELGSAEDYAAPGITGEYDHLVSLQLGGANATSNLWPEPGSVPNPKDQVETALKRLVCAGKMPLAEAQRRIATDWTTAVPR